MKIMLANKHFLGLSGGAERNVSDMANWLDAFGHEVVIFSEMKYGNSPSFPVRERVKILTPTETPTINKDIVGEREPDLANKEWAHANRAMRRKWRNSVEAIDPDVIITFMPHTSTVMLYELGHEYPIIVTNQNDPAVDYFSDKHGADETERQLRIALLERAQAVHFLIPEFAAKMPENVQQKAIIVPNAVRQMSTRVSNSTTNKIVALGRLVPQKGFEILIEAFAASHASKTGWELHIFGEGPDEDKLRLLVRKLMSQRKIYLRGHTSNPDQELAEAGMFAIPSVYEGWGLSLTEAMANSVPAIGFCDCPGVNWLIQNNKNGLLIERSILALSQAIDRLAVDPGLRSQLGQAGRQSVKRFSPQEVYGRWNSIISTVLAEGKL